MGRKKTEPTAAEVDQVIADKVTNYFTENPTKAVVHTTTDGFLFPKLSFARDHAQSLGEDQEATTHKNPLFIEVETEEESEEEETE